MDNLQCRVVMMDGPWKMKIGGQDKVGKKDKILEVQSRGSCALSSAAGSMKLG